MVDLASGQAVPLRRGGVEQVKWVRLGAHMVRASASQEKKAPKWPSRALELTREDRIMKLVLSSQDMGKACRRNKACVLHGYG
jgi:hypothetical protein